MSKWIFDSSLPITIFIILCRIDQGCTCFNGIGDNQVHIRDKKPDSNGSAIVCHWIKEIGFGCYFMKVKQCSVNRKFRNMNASIFISKAPEFYGAESSFIKRDVP